jgi:hypothetical protein
MNTDAVTALMMGAFLATCAYLIHLKASRIADRRRQARLRLSAEAVSRLQAAIDRREVVVLKGDGATLHVFEDIGGVPREVLGGIDAAWLLEAESGSVWHPSKGDRNPV